MLKGVDPRLTPDLLAELARAGHGDAIAIVDRNYPAYSAGPPVIDMAGVTAEQAMDAVGSVTPLDTFQSPAISHMLTDDGLESPATGPTRALWRQHDPDATEAGIDRKAFYERARGAVLIVRTGETRPYGCYLLIKGIC